MERPREPNRRRQGRPGRPSRQERISRFLAFLLRHRPEEAGLELDERGAAGLEEVVEAVRARPGLKGTTRDEIEHLATSEASGRFEITGDRIRARYGHTFARLIRHEPAEPPDTLFHGTTPDAAEQILTEGLEPTGRQYVHLSPDTPAAREVGRRRCESPVSLRIDTLSARKVGVRFYPASPAVWLSGPIPPECITRLE